MGPIPIKPTPQAFTYCKNRPGFYKTILVIPSGRWEKKTKNMMTSFLKNEMLASITTTFFEMPINKLQQFYMAI
jgi:hypothetical protein